MSQKIPIPVLTIKYKGLFDSDGLYKLIADWYTTNNYGIKEDKYIHTVPTALGAQQEIVLSGVQPVTDYILYNVKARIRMFEMTEVNVTKEGKKAKLTKARLIIELSGDVTVDWQNKFSKTKFREFLGKLLYKGNSGILRRDMGAKYVDPLQYRLLGLQGIIKKYLSLQSSWNEYAGYLGEER